MPRFQRSIASRIPFVDQSGSAMAFLAAFFIFASCVKKPGQGETDANYKKTREGAEEKSGATVLSDQDGEVKAAITDNNRSTSIAASSTGGAAGAAVTFPPGSLAVGSEVTIGEGAGIASGLAAADLGLENNNISSGGKAVAVQGPEGAVLATPMSLSLPLGAALTLVQGNRDLLVIIYKIKTEDGSFKLGILPRGELTVTPVSVDFSSKYFGVFQIGYTSQLVSVKKEVPSATPVLTVKAAQTLPPLTWQTQTPVPSGTSGVTFAAALAGVSGVNRCTLIVDEDQKAPFDHSSEIMVPADGPLIPSKLFNRSKNIAHAVNGQIHCRALDGREASTQWMPYSFAEVGDGSGDDAPVVTSSLYSTDGLPSWSWIGVGAGTGRYRYKVDSSDMATGSTIVSATSYKPSSALSEGPHTLYVQMEKSPDVWTSTGSHEVIVDTSPPVVPANLYTEDEANAGDVRVIANSSAVLRWSAPSDVQSGIRDVKVIVYNQSGCAGVSVNQISTTAASTVTQTLVGGVTYSFKVEVNNNANLQSTSACSGSIVYDDSAPLPLDQFDVQPSFDFGKTMVSINVPSNISDYQSIQVRRVAGVTPPNAACTDGQVVANITNIVDQVFEDGGMNPGGFYSYRACIYDVAGNLTSAQVKAYVLAGSYRVFATNAVFDGNLKAGYASQTFYSGLHGGDFRCQYSAQTAQLPGIWRAWLSDGNHSADRRFHFSTGAPILDIRGEKIADSKTDLYAPPLDVAITYNENQQLLTTDLGVWTGTSDVGLVQSNRCDNWQSSSNGSSGIIGGADHKLDAYWTAMGSETCDQTNRLYCIKQKAPGLRFFKAMSGTVANQLQLFWDFQTISGINLDQAYGSITFRMKNGTTPPDSNCTNADGSMEVHSIVDGQYTANGNFLVQTGVTDGDWYSFRACVFNADGDLEISHAAPWPVLAGQRVFVTSTPYPGNLGGLIGADGICASEAFSAGLPAGVWKAVLSSSSEAAVTRLAINRKVYNISGSPTLIATSAADFFNGLHPANAIVEPNGNPWTGTYLYTWANFNDSGAIPASSLHCNNWTDGTSGNSGFRIYHEEANLAEWANPNESQICSQSARLYCVSQ